MYIPYTTELHFKGSAIKFVYKYSMIGAHM